MDYHHYGHSMTKPLLYGCIKRKKIHLLFMNLIKFLIQFLMKMLLNEIYHPVFEKIKKKIEPYERFCL